MTIANGAQHSLHFVAESTYGTTPSSPTWTPIPHTGTTLGITKDGIESEKLRGDRQIEDFRRLERLAARLLLSVSLMIWRRWSITGIPAARSIR